MILRECALVAFGGAGPLHASALASGLGIPTVIIPPHPGHFSAMGMLSSDIRHDFAQTQVLSLESAKTDLVAGGLAGMEQKAIERLTREGVKAENFRFARSVDVRYQGQEHTLNVPLSAVEDDFGWKSLVRTRFEEMYLVRYGHSAKNEPLEMVTLRLSAIGVTSKSKRPKVKSDGTTPPAKSRKDGRAVMFQFRSKAVETAKFDVYTRESLTANNIIEGPAIIEEYASTTIVLPGYVAQIGTYGDIIIKNQTHARSPEIPRNGAKN